ncbi:MBL fold metallo-hydrolase [Pseudomonas sp. F1_0610]|uniref:MBL fold metallo-hydrolase n=1 Tax=Pseudomonas sp. F1_0610 TaxID=3114284 RepID=UPI0039C46C31
MAKIKTYEVGYCTHPGCMALKGASWRVCQFPARAWLIEANQKRWLLDTGYASHFHEQTQQGILQLYPKVTPVFFQNHQALVHQLATEGIRPNDLSGIIISHFHGDHIAGLKDFPLLDLICAEQGWLATKNLRGFSALRKAFVPGLMPVDTEARLSFIERFKASQLPTELSMFEVGYILPHSNDEVILIPLPGHAAGHIGVAVLTEAGWQILASDAAWSPTNYIELRGPSILAYSIMDDRKAYFATLKKLQQAHLQGLNISLCHEGDLL